MDIKINFSININIDFSTIEILPLVLKLIIAVSGFFPM